MISVTSRPCNVYANRNPSDGGLATLTSGVAYVFQFKRAKRRGSHFTFAGANNTRITYVGPRPLQVWASCVIEARRSAGQVAGGWLLSARKNGVATAGGVEFEGSNGPSQISPIGSVTIPLPARRLWLQPNDYLEFEVTQFTGSSWTVQSLHALVVDTGFGLATPQEGDTALAP